MICRPPSKNTGLNLSRPSVVSCTCCLLQTCGSWAGARHSLRVSLSPRQRNSEVLPEERRRGEGVGVRGAKQSQRVRIPPHPRPLSPRRNLFRLDKLSQAGGEGSMGDASLLGSFLYAILFYTGF